MVYIVMVYIVMATAQGVVLHACECTHDEEVAQDAAEALKKTLLVFDAFNDVTEKAEAGNDIAKEVIQSLPENVSVALMRFNYEEGGYVKVAMKPGRDNYEEFANALDSFKSPSTTDNKSQLHDHQDAITSCRT